MLDGHAILDADDLQSLATYLPVQAEAGPLQSSCRPVRARDQVLDRHVESRKPASRRSDNRSESGRPADRLAV